MSERLGDLTSRERQLVDAAASGDGLECSQLPIEQLSATDDPEHTIRAELLRELLLNRCDKPPDPRGVRLRGARITGTLDLSHVEAVVGMELRNCPAAATGCSPTPVDLERFVRSGPAR